MASYSFSTVAHPDRSTFIHEWITLRFAAANLLSYARTHLRRDVTWGTTLGKTMGIVRVYAPNSGEYNGGDRELHELFTLTQLFRARLVPNEKIHENHMNMAVESTYTQYPQD